MSFEIEQREQEGIPIIALRGRLVGGDTLTALRDRALRMIAQGVRTVVLDMSQVSYIDSSGLGFLVLCHTRVAKEGGRLPIFGLNRRGIELLVLTKLATIFELYDCEIDAVNSCFPGRNVKHFDVLEFVREQKHSGEPQ